MPSPRSCRRFRTRCPGRRRRPRFRNSAPIQWLNGRQRRRGIAHWRRLLRPVTAAFEKKYPGIKVRSTRANATETAVKILNEGKAGRTQADVFDGTTTVVPLKQAGYVLKWLPDASKDYPDDLKDPEGY